MLLRDMFDRILMESGQFLMKEEIELDIDRFSLLVKSALSTYSKFSPYHKKFNLNVVALGNSFGGLAYTFTESQTTQLKSLSDIDDSPFDLIGETKIPNQIPDWISDIIPVRLAGVHPFYFHQMEQRANPELEVKLQFPWEYNKPTLYVPVQSLYEVTAVYKHRIVGITYKDPQNGTLRKEGVVRTISDADDDFFKLLTGKFMKALGRNRRAFTLNELPITQDSAELVSEGDQMEKDALQDLETKSHKFWLAYR